jgi:hypothetical protein
MADEDVVRARPETQVSDHARGGASLRLATPDTGRVAGRAVICPVLMSRQSDSEGWAGRRDGVHFRAEPPAADGVAVDPGRRPGRRPGRSPSLLSSRARRDRASVSLDMPAPGDTTTGAGASDDVITGRMAACLQGRRSC